MRARIGHVQPIQEFHDGLQIFQIFFRNLFTLLNGADHFRNIGRQLCHSVRIEVRFHALVEASQIRRCAK